MEFPNHQHDNQIPYHQLMSEETKQNNSNQWKPMGGKFDRDFLSKRHQALSGLCRLKEQAASKNGTEGRKVVPQTETETSSETKLWSGASPLERALISCCTTGDAETGADWEAETDVDEGTWVTGALRETKMLEFIGLTTMHCQDLASRSLALAMLERTHQLDERIKENFEMNRQALASHSLDNSETQSNTEDNKPSPSKRPRINQGDRPPVDPASLVMVHPKPPPPRRLMLFLGTQGLRILSRWLVEASEPVIMDVHSKETKEVRSRVRPSPTGLLLLPLLEFLANIPFRKQFIVQSKINKVIKKLSKHVDSLVIQAQAEGRALEKWTHADTGGLPVPEVQAALNNIKLSWETKAKVTDKGKNHVTGSEDPLAQLNALLKDRLEDLKNFDSGKIDMPVWLSDAEKEEEKKPPIAETNISQRHPRIATSEEKARKERENERHNLMKKDLEMARQEKLKLLKKLREMKKPNENVECARPPSRRGVKWKDGLPASSKQRRRDVLESVFVFDSEHVKLVECETESTSDSPGKP